MNKKQKPQNERLWNEDLFELLENEFPKLRIFKRKKILRDITVQKKEKTNEFELQLGFFEQDIVICGKNDDINLPKKVPIKIHNNNSSEQNKIMIPSIIIELKYDGVDTHGIIKYSTIASNLKSIFPKCKYVFALRYNSGCGDNKLLRDGINFDNILYFENSYKKSDYYKGQFKEEIKKSTEIKKKWKSLIRFIRSTMVPESDSFLK